MIIEEFLLIQIKKAIKEIYFQDVDYKSIQIQKTKKDFKGDFTVNVFPLLKISKKKPEETANEIGLYLQNNCSDINAFEVIKGFLNLTLTDNFWIKSFNTINEILPTNNNILIEFSSPNTNKPLHLGHVRNNLIGFSISEILKESGNNVIKVNLVNDRGIHICKSMLAWQKWGDNITPEKSNKKGDKLVGDFYVMFDKEYKKQVSELVSQGIAKEEAEKKAQLIIEAHAMLKKWEENNSEVKELWSKMNSWVYKGFDETYKLLGITFNKIYYESETYKLGKSEVIKGVESGLLIKKDDGSIVANLTEDGLDEKVLLRSDGTSVYITQDIGTALMRKNEFNAAKMIYVVGNEQNYHFQALKLILKKLGYTWFNDVEHLSYGMVELPDGKMKSREGTVVDADDLINQMFETAKTISSELGKLEGLSDIEKQNVIKTVGIGALKYFILKVDPKKNMLFNPVESIDFNGNTGPFVQYTYARINSLLKKADELKIKIPEIIEENIALNESEKNIIKILQSYQNTLFESAKELNPAIIANFVYALVKEYNLFYHDFSILKEPDKNKQILRLTISKRTAVTIKKCMSLLGINVPERM